MDIYNSNKIPEQAIFDAFNMFIFSDDIRIISKLFYRFKFFLKTKDLPGDIIECGVFKGSGMISWLKMIKIYCNNSNKKVIGFDFFENSFVNNLDDKDKIIGDVFNRCNIENEISLESIHHKIQNAGFDKSKYELIQGDICNTVVKYSKDRIGMRISILYLDLDLDKPTYETLIVLWDRVVKGGYIIFDEYGYHQWTESNAVDKFIKDKNLKLYSINSPAPTAYIKK